MTPLPLKDSCRTPLENPRTIDELGRKNILILIVACLGFGLLLLSSALIIPNYDGVLDGLVVWEQLLAATVALPLAGLFYNCLHIPAPLFVIAVIVQIALWALHFLVPGGTSGPLSYLQLLSGFTLVVFLLEYIRFLASYPPFISRFTILISYLLSHLFACIPFALPMVETPLLQAFIMLVALVALCVCLRETLVNSLPPSSRPICPESAQPPGAITASSDLARLNTLGVNRPQSKRQTINQRLHGITWPLPKLKDRPKWQAKSFVWGWVWATSLSENSKIGLIRSGVLTGFGTVLIPFFYGIYLQISYVENLNMALSDQISELLIAAALLVLMVIFILIDKNFSFEKLFLIMVPFFATILLIMPLFWDSTPLSSLILARAGFVVYHVALWIWLARITYTKPEKRLSYFALALGMMWLSILVGQYLGFELFARVGTGVVVITGVSLIAVWLLVMAVALLLGIQLRRQGGTSQESTGGATVALSDKIATFSEIYGLSPRETEILMEFSRGRSAAYVSNAFFISEHTVKTHLRRIYAKADVHNRQDLLDLIEKNE